jgi:UTP-glucose-1-phosphate uridylyltransferase
MNNNIFSLKIDYMQTSKQDKCPMINIVYDENFYYSCMFNIYKTESGMGHGLQCSEEYIGKEQILMAMCDKIAKIIYDTKKELENG